MNSGRSRRRSLRVPLDEVPRRLSNPDAALEPIESLEAIEELPSKPPTIPPPRPRSVPPSALDAGRATDPSFGQPSDASLENADLANEMLSEDELGRLDASLDARSSDAETGGALDLVELESEPTSILPAALEASDALGEAHTSPGDAFAPDELAASPTVMVQAELPDDDEPALSIAEGEQEEPSQIIEVGEPSEREEPPAERLSQPGVILVQRTISIGVGAPTHTTTAKERESSPPAPELSEPAFEISDSEIAPSSDAEIHVSAELPALPLEAPPKPEEREAEELDELDVVDARVDGRSAPPPPPAAAPPPPPREAQRPPPPPKAPPQAAIAPSPVPVDVETGKRTRKKWWEEFFNDDYFRTVPLPQPRTIVSQSAFIAQRLGLPLGSTILDVGCGLGLHAVELTRLGYTVVALDLSLPMLSRAADEAQDQGLKINFLQADMREMAFESMFDAVLCWGTTFGYFDDDQNRNVVERLHRALKPGGLLLLDVVNRDYVVRTTPNSAWFQGDGCVVMEETNCNYINSRLTVKRQVMLDDGRQNETVYTIRLYSLHELGQILHQRGFRVVEVSGREATPGVFFGSESPRLIIVAERRPDATPSRRPDEGSSSESQVMQSIREPRSEPVKLDAPKAQSSDTGRHEAVKAEPAKEAAKTDPGSSEPGRGE